MTDVYTSRDNTRIETTCRLVVCASQCKTEIAVAACQGKLLLGVAQLATALGSSSSFQAKISGEARSSREPHGRTQLQSTLCA